MSVTEFTGERVVPGQVDADLWNEHFARYAFATRLAEKRRVLDAGCGTGYGSAELARVAASVTGIDVASEAIAYATDDFAGPQLDFKQASCLNIPFDNSSFDLVVCFEVIEHLAEWPKLIEEARRVLAPGGQFVVSTPNKSFYAETRRDSGPNPYHEHEFEHAEFAAALQNVFPHVSIYLEDHVESVAFRTPGNTDEAHVRLERREDIPEESSFFIAVCSLQPTRDVPAFVYIPRTANALAEKLLHIQRLEDEVAKKNSWLAQEQATHQELLRQHKAVHEELLNRNRWAQDLSTELDQARHRIAALQEELRAMEAGYESQVARLSAELEERARWMTDTEQQLNSQLASCVADRDEQIAQLGRCAELLQRAEATVVERTNWAMSLDEERSRLRSAVAGSLWMRLGRAIGLAPELK